MILALTGGLLRIGILINPPEKLTFSMLEPYAAALIKIPGPDFFTPLENVLLALLISLIQAVLINTVANKYNLLGKQSFLPALMFVTVSSLLVPFLVLSPVLFCNFLFIWMIDRFLSVSRQESAQAVMFDLGMIIATGTLFYFAFASMMILLWMCLMIFRPFNWREWIAGLIGFATIYFFIAVAYYWTDSLALFDNFKVTLATDFTKILQFNIYNYLAIIPVMLILLLSVFSLQRKLYRSNVHIRKSYLFLFLVLMVSMLSFLLVVKHPVTHFLLAVPAASIFMAFYFNSAVKPWFYESLYLLLAVVIIYFQIL